MADTQLASTDDAPDLRKNDVPAEARENVREGKLAPRVFWPAAIIMAVFIGLTLAFPQKAKDLFSALQSDVISYLGWYYVAIVAFFVIFALYLGFSRLGDIKIGNDDEPEFSFMTWFAFLFAAGMGIGLVFYGGTEPLMHFVTPPPGVEGSEAEVAQAAMSRSFLHWGLHPWAIYVIVGLAIAYSAHRLKMPLSIRYALKPLLGDRVKGAWGDTIDVIALVGTLFGVATSLGLGVMQIAAGLNYLDIPAEGNVWLVGIIVVLMGITLVSVVTGLEKGMKILSNGNLILAAVVCIFVLIVGPTIFLLREFIGNMGNYLQNFVTLTFDTMGFYGDDGEKFQAAWTTFYWGWWISWSPFVGVFIARISRGRTVREFIMGVMLVPTLVTILWFTVMGGTAIYKSVFEGVNFLNAEGAIDKDLALFQVFETMPASSLLSGLAILLVTIFFVTSADSGAFVVDMIAHRGDPEPPRGTRIFWAVTSGAIPAALIGIAAYTGSGDASGMSGLQALALIAALPWSVVMIAMVVSMFRALRHEVRMIERLELQIRRRELVEHVTEHVTDEVADRVYERVATETGQLELPAIDASEAAPTEGARKRGFLDQFTQRHKD